MNVGITYDLRDEYRAAGYGEEETAEFDRGDTIDAIRETLQDLGYATDCIGHAKHLVMRLARGERWDIVFNIAEGMYGFGREALIPALLEAYQIPYTFSDPLVLALTLHKGLTKQIIRDLHIPTPEFALVETEAEIEKVSLPFPLFAKPVAEGTGKGITATSKIHSSTELYDVCHNLLLMYTQPVLVETFLPGREFTVGIVGTGRHARTLGTLEVLLHDDAEHDVYSYVNKEHCEELVEYRLVNDTLAKQAEEVALAAWKGLGCRDAGRIDLRTDRNGTPHFIEVNPLAGLHPEHSDLSILCSLIEMSYHELIDTIMRSALQRVHTSETPSSLKKAA